MNIVYLYVEWTRRPRTSTHKDRALKIIPQEKGSEFILKLAERNVTQKREIKHTKAEAEAAAAAAEAEAKAEKDNEVNKKRFF